MVVLGAGVAGLQAIATARRLGAVVEASDVRPAVKEQVESLGARFIEPPERAAGAEDAGGYAREVGADFLQRQQQIVGEHLANADVVITTALVPGKRAPLLVTADIVARMKPGSVIVDMAVEQGGNCELSQPGQNVRRHGVLIVGHKNLAATMPADASLLYSRNVLALLEPMVKKGELTLNADDEIMSSALITHAGRVSHLSIAEQLGLLCVVGYRSRAKGGVMTTGALLIAGLHPGAGDLRRPRADPQGAADLAHAGAERDHCGSWHRADRHALRGSQRRDHARRSARRGGSRLCGVQRRGRLLVDRPVARGRKAKGKPRMKPEILRGLVELSYLASALVFVGGLKRLTKLRTARSGNSWMAAAMLIAVAATLTDLGSIDYRWIAAGLLLGSVAGALVALGTKPQSALGSVALLAGFAGLASGLVAASAVVLHVIEPRVPGTVAERIGPGATGGFAACALAAAIWLGPMATLGGVVAFVRLKTAAKRPIEVPARGVVNGVLLLAALALGGAFAAIVDTPTTVTAALGLLGLAGAALGIALVLPFGKKELPAAVAVLNALSAGAACAIGLVIMNVGLIAGGAMFAAASLIHARLLLQALKRSLPSVVFGSPRADESASVDADAKAYKDVRSCGVEEAAMVLEEARDVVVVPGYGLAVAQAQNAARELSAQLEKRGCRVRYAVHPFAGRMPGHMNVLLSEADIPYEKLVELDAVNPEFAQTDAVIVIGANDVVNPAAERDQESPLYGVPILQAYKARSVFVIKRSLRAGHEGVKNPLFEAENATMIYGDAKKVLQALTSELKGTGLVARGLTRGASRAPACSFQFA